MNAAGLKAHRAIRAVLEQSEFGSELSYSDIADRVGCGEVTVHNVMRDIAREKWPRTAASGQVREGGRVWTFALTPPPTTD